MTVADARGMTPYSAAAGSAQALDDAARTSGRLGFGGNVLGYGLQPAIGAAVEYRDLPDDATAGERAAALVGGALAETDDVLFSGGVGAGVEGLTAMTGAGAPAAPYTGAAAGMAAGRYWDGSRADEFVDDMVESYVEPVVTVVDGYIVPAGDYVIDRLSDLEERARSRSR